ncbi:hypothetical protein Y1Q_0016519 [Alligator mississippiensis]|uniref:Uncharacterized protein n=1 Tax=Alligator mississippiensis TaxID=8496 RepID=A0A151N348_ALLMI|nr:hypothetical protein Y1Q_0016519 [Alligator mississippiensis]
MEGTFQGQEAPAYTLHSLLDEAEMNEAVKSVVRSCGTWRTSGVGSIKGKVGSARLTKTRGAVSLPREQLQEKGWSRRGRERCARLLQMDLIAQAWSNIAQCNCIRNSWAFKAPLQRPGQQTDL